MPENNGVKATASNDLVGVVENLRETILDDRLKSDQRQEKLDGMQKELLERLDKQQRTVEYPDADVDAFNFAPNPETFKSQILDRRPVGKSAGLIEEIQRKHDEVMITEAIRAACRKSRVPNTPDSLSGTKQWDDYATLVGHINPKVGEVMKTSLGMDTAESANWIPADMSRNLHEFIMMDLKVASLFQEFTLPTSTYNWPHVTTTPAAAYLAESADYAASFVEPDDSLAMFPTDPDGTTQFVARKIRAFQFYTREWVQDSIPATLPWLMRELPKAVGRAWDSACINGDSAGTGIGDNATTEASTWFNGLRYGAIHQGTWAGDATDTHAYQFNQNMSTPGTWAIDEFPKLLRIFRKRMSKYGVMMPDLVFIVGMDAYFQLMTISNFQTLDKLGPQATLLTGQVGAFDSIPVVLSEFSDLSVEGKDGSTDEENGINQATYTRESKFMLLVHRSEWLRGRLPSMGVESVRYAHSDNYMVVLFERGDFQNIGPDSALNLMYGYDIPLFT